MAERGAPAGGGSPPPGAPPHPGAPDALVITGPTATGKTALSLRVAELLDGEILSMDSRQVYRGMDLGTAKATAGERARVPHHGLDLVDPDERYSAGRFARDALRTIREIRTRGRVPILVGGTGFFLRALTHPLFTEPELPREPRRRLARYLGGLPTEALRRWLRVLDPETAAGLEGGGGAQRLARALEVALLSGRPLSWWHRHSPPEREPLRLLIFVVDLPVEELDRRIDGRVDAMLEAGLLEEVRRLVGRGYHEGQPGMTGTGYRELIPVVRGSGELGEAAEAVKRNTRRYARRQRTWFRHQLPAEGVVRLDGLRPTEALAAEVAERWRAEAREPRTGERSGGSER